MDSLKEVLTGAIFGIAMWQIVAAAAAILLGFLARPLLMLVIKRLRRIAEKTKTELDDILISALERPLGLAAIFTGIAVALAILPLPTVPVNIQRFIDALVQAFYIILAVWFFYRLLDGLCDYWKSRATGTETKVDDQLVPVVRNSGKTFLVIIGGLIVVQSLGYSVGSLLAGLGIGGAAIALASKDTIANLFGSIVIFVDKPFMVGDWVEIGDQEGTVEEVGMRTTRIRTFANSLITIPNSLLTTTAINNWSRMKKRRIKMTIGLTYDTTPDQMVAAVAAIREVIKNDEKISQDFHLINFTELGAYSLEIFIYCFTVTTDWSAHLQARQDFIVNTMKAIYDLGLTFAFPTQTVQLADAEKLALKNAPAAMEKDLPG